MDEIIKKNKPERRLGSRLYEADFVLSWSARDFRFAQFVRATSLKSAENKAKYWARDFWKDGGFAVRVKDFKAAWRSPDGNAIIRFDGAKLFESRIISLFSPLEIDERRMKSILRKPDLYEARSEELRRLLRGNLERIK